MIAVSVAFLSVALAHAHTPWVVPRGGSTEYSAKLEQVKATVLEKAASSIDGLKRAILDESSVVDDFGSKADSICIQALEDFATSAPQDDGSSSQEVYDKKLEELEASLDAPLQVLYLRQLTLLRQEALERYRSASKTSEMSEHAAIMTAERQFAQQAEASTREGSTWDFSAERSYLVSVMNNIAESSKASQSNQLEWSQKHQTAMQVLQQQQQMIQQLQMQLYGQTSPWNVGLAYRIPDTNFNLQGSYQQGRANVQLSCVPDDYAPMLGPNGFTQGVGPGNLGLSLNLSI